MDEDYIDAIRDGWARERPDFPLRSVGVTSMVWRLARLLTARRSETLRDLGMDQSMLDLLACLRRSGPPYALAAGEVARRCGVTAAAISQRSVRAVDAGWVARESRPEDGRGVHLRLTRSGIRAVDEVAGAVLHHDEGLVAALSDGQLDQLERHLRLLEQSVLLAHEPDTPVGG